MKNFFGFTNWPDEVISDPLSDCRSLDIVPMPRHSNASVAFYDRTTGIRLQWRLGNFAKYRASIQRLVTSTSS